MYLSCTSVSAFSNHSSSQSCWWKYSSFKPGWRTEDKMSRHIRKESNLVTHCNLVHQRKICHWIILIELLAHKLHHSLDGWMVWLLHCRIKVIINFVHSWYHSCYTGSILREKYCCLLVLPTIIQLLLSSSYFPNFRSLSAVTWSAAFLYMSTKCIML